MRGVDHMQRRVIGRPGEAYHSMSKDGTRHKLGDRRMRGQEGRTETEVVRPSVLDVPRTLAEAHPSRGPDEPFSNPNLQVSSVLSTLEL